MADREEQVGVADRPVAAAHPELPALEAADFPSFYAAVHGHDPFPWQSQVVADVLQEGQWPDLIDVPTGLGKTSIIDVAVFVTAATVGTPAAQRMGRRRILFVVDRRLVVDEAAEHAERLSGALARAEHDSGGGVVTDVARALRACAPYYPRRHSPDVGPGDLLPVTRMRGGTTWAAAWLDRPDRPGIVLGTVDQVGSRLLFRGYGVSDRRRPIDAALVGTDALLLVDEAHLSTALLATLAAIGERDTLRVPVPRLNVVRLSATAGEARRVFALDVETHKSNEHAWCRLTAGKVLTTVSTTAKDCEKTLADTVLNQVAQLATTQRNGQYAPVAAVICNTVDRARAVHNLLMRRLSARGSAVDADCELLIGRTRPMDRTIVQDLVRERFGTGRRPQRRAAIVVATQTVEVGVNLDVDILVTESASWDALVQRLGRLNRLGEFASRFDGLSAAPAVVVHDERADGPVYGAARDATWGVLSELVAQRGTLDVSPLACRQLTSEQLAGQEYVMAPVGVPVLLRPTLDAWVQTAPVPLIDPPVEPFLHGFGRGRAPVHVLWRSGLVGEDVLDDPFEDGGAELSATAAHRALTDIPPRSDEIVEVPFVAVRQWMRGLAPDPVSDLDTAGESEGRAKPVREPFRVLVRRASTAVRSRTAQVDRDGAAAVWCWITAADLRPADLVVVPAEYGGLDRYGWAPADTSPVDDIAEPAAFGPGRGLTRGVLRLDRRHLVARLGLSEAVGAAVIAALDELAEADDDRDLPAHARQATARLADLLPPASTHHRWDTERWQRFTAWLRSPGLRLVPAADDADARIAGSAALSVWGGFLVGPVPVVQADAVVGRATGRGPEPVLFSPDRDDEGVVASSVGGERVTLATHHAAVRERASHIALALGLPDELCRVLEDAARFHDLGKCEKRFQVMLHGGDPIEMLLSPEPLAKSGMDPADREVWRRAATTSGLPRGARHEAWSAALVEAHLENAGPNSYPGDAQLLLHLVASHHGYARPWPRLVNDTAPCEVVAEVDGQTVSISSGRTVSLAQPTRFAHLNDRYGRWGLALLESIVRCADMTVSEEGS